jgi:hypothetical protein
MIIFHPILFALYPPIALLANNILQIRPVDALRSVVVFLIFGSLVFLVSWLIVRNWMQAGLLSSVFLLSFSIYGQVYDALEKSNTADLVIGRHRFLAPIWLVLTVAILIFVVRSKGDLKIGNQLFNLISVILIGFPIIQLGSSAWSTYQNSRSNSETVSQITHTLGQQTVAKPDVYYIILDMYGRDDVLLDKFKFDNTEFLADLEEMGFYVGR